MYWKSHDILFYLPFNRAINYNYNALQNASEVLQMQWPEILKQ